MRSIDSTSTAYARSVLGKLPWAPTLAGIMTFEVQISIYKNFGAGPLW
jgi:hypothetical protein